MGDGEDARQTGKWIATQGIINELVDDDVYVVLREAQTAERAGPKGSRFGHAQSYGVGRVWIEPVAGCAR